VVVEPAASTAGALGSFADGCQRLAPAAAVVVAAVLALRRLDDFDTWWHLASGRWILTAGSIPSTDTLSFTVPTHPWINLQWLYDSALYLLYRLDGADALVVTSVVAYSAAIWLLTKNLRLYVGGVAAALLTIWVLAVAEERFLIRPEMVSFVLLEALLWLLLTARDDDGRRLWLLVPLMLVWVNCHSLFIIGLFCMGCAAGAALVGRLRFMPAAVRYGSQLSPVTARRLWIAAGAAAAATVVNPYGINGALFPFKLLSRINGSSPAFQSIGEFRSPFAGSFPTFSLTAYKAFLVCGGIVLICGTLASLATPRRAAAPRRPGAGVDVGHIAIFVGLAYLSVLARRNIALFVLAGAPLVASWLAALYAKVATRTQQRLQAAARSLAPAVVIGCVALMVVVASNAYYRWDGTTREFGLGVFEENFPIHAVAFAKEIGAPPKLYNDLTAGGYLTWDAPVDGGVFIDGRLEVYDTAFFAAYSNALNNPRLWEQQADRSGINTVILFHRWLNRHPLIQALIASRRWVLVYYDEVAVILVRAAQHEEVIEKARRLFPEWQRMTQARLAAPVSRWRWPIARASGLDTYATLLLTLGYPQEAVASYQRLIDLGLPPAQEAAARLKIASYFMRIGDTRQARAQLDVAAARDPGNADVQRLLARLGG
jgi:tetratricopeptide (TPR) repeat protein